MTKPYILAGFATLNANSIGFLIPYFLQRNSDQAFAQELDDNFRIKHFQPFALDSYDTISSKPEPVSRKAGDVGVVAFALDNEEILYDTPVKLKNELRKMDTVDDPFLRLEVCMFLGDFEGTKEAIQATALSFTRKEVRATWVEVETRLSNERRAENIEEEYVSPPRLAEAIIGVLAYNKAREFLLGDMEERFHDDVRKFGVARARARYWTQTFRSTGPLALYATSGFGILVQILSMITKWLAK